MIKYIAKRLLLFIPTIFIDSILVFLLSINAPGDPVENMLNSSKGGDISLDRSSSEKAYMEMREKLNLHLPAFYFAVTSSAFPDTLHQVPRKSERKTLTALTHQFGNWEAVSQYFQTYKGFRDGIYNAKIDSATYDAQLKLYDIANTLEYQPNMAEIQHAFKKMEALFQANAGLSSLAPAFEATRKDYQSLVDNSTKWKHYIPAIHWYGSNNQYHKWISKFITFDFGYSYQDKRPISDKIGDNIFWTVLMSVVSILLIYLLSIPLGIFSAMKKGTWIDSLLTTVLFILYSLPSFWVATLLIIFFCQSEYLDWFPSHGVGEVYEEMPWFVQLQIRASHLFLPIFCWTYGSLAFLSRQMRGGFLNVFDQDYIRTAKAKGLGTTSIVWKHTFKNSLLPIITLFASVFPSMISGSVVIEQIFSIPGMGKMMIDAIQFKDFPVVFTIVMMSSILTMIGYLVADILYAWIDPRITFK